MKKAKMLALAALTALTVIMPLVMPSCTRGGREIKIGVLREDNSSGEAAAWEEYLKTIGGELGFTVDFTTTNNSSSEVAAINTYASKGYDAIMLFSDDDIAAAVDAASSNKMYIVCPTEHPSAAQYEKIMSNEYYLGSAAPDEDTEYRAGYGMAKYFAETLGQTAFTVFGGSTEYGSVMHVQRLAGMLAYLCEDLSTNYDGVKTRDQLAARFIGAGLNPVKFRSEKYRITGYMSGFSFDDAFSAKLTESLKAGGTGILSVSSGGTVSKIAHGIVSSDADISPFAAGGIGAITSEYGDLFDSGYAYNCGKPASAPAAGIIMILSAVNGKRIANADGTAPRIPANYWVATSKEELLSMLASDNKDDGYCYNSAVLKHYAGGTLEELKELCSADYSGALAINKKYGGGSGD